MPRGPGPLGVYVLGAIDPADRALVEAHLTTCRDCRDELAGLAGLPALLSRVPPKRPRAGRQRRTAPAGRAGAVKRRPNCSPPLST